MAFFDFFLQPWVVALGWMATVVGCLSGFYFYWKSRAVRRLSLYVAPGSAQIVRAGQSSKLTVAFNGQPVTTDISAAQLTIWNAGTLPIRRENVLKPLALVTGEQIPILEATLRANSREVTGASLDTSQLSKGRLGVNWNIFEQADGVTLQLIFAGPPDTSIGAEVVIEGQGEIALVPRETNRSPMDLLIVVISVALACSGLVVALLYIWAHKVAPPRALPDSPWSPQLSLWLSGSASVMLLYVATKLRWRRGSAPPKALLELPHQ